jgi:hypothetical protein
LQASSDRQIASTLSGRCLLDFYNVKRSRSELRYAQSENRTHQLLTQAEDRDRDGFKSRFAEHPFPTVRAIQHQNAKRPQGRLTGKVAARFYSVAPLFTRLKSRGGLVARVHKRVACRATTLSSQTTGQRAGSVHLVEKLCSFFFLDIQKHSWRASGQEGPRGIGSGCEAPSARTSAVRSPARHIVREHDTTQPVLNKDITRAQGVCPWSLSQEGARGQGSSACRGTPSKGEAPALHHQPVSVLTLTMTCLSCSRPTFDRWIH